MSDDDPDADRRASMAVVNWWYPDESVVTGCPMPYSAAEAVARAYLERYPERRSWVSVSPPLAVRRRRGVRRR